MFEFFYNLAGLNSQIFLTINHATNTSILPRVLQLISWPFGIDKFAICYAVLAAYFFFKLKKLDLYSQEKEFWPLFNKMMTIGITYTVFGFIYAALKFSINLPRPFCSLPADSFHTIINTANERCLSSFPSAHTGLAVIITYFLWSYLRTSGKLTAIAVIALVGISRMTLAMHYPADIIYSFFIAFLIIMIGHIIYRIFENNIIKWVGGIILKFIMS